LIELEANLAAARKARNTVLCRLLSEAVKKQAEADAALEVDDYDSVDRLDAEVSILPLSIISFGQSLVYLS